MKIPKFESIEELTTFFDENDLGEYLDCMPDAAFEVELTKRTRFVAVDEEIADQISEISKREHVPSGVIVNNWLKEKLSSYSKKN
jgi:hypothetical protein